MFDGKRWKKIIMGVGLFFSALFLIVGCFLAGRRNGLPVGLVSHYSAGMLWEEAVTMNECAECHEAEAYHSCSDCHDDHGAVEFAELPFYALIAFTGDVPDPGYIEVHDVLPYQDHPNTHLPLLELLERQGVDDFDRVAMTSRDGGLVTIQKEDLNQSALLMPYADGVRFASEDLHVSTWLKGLNRIIVVGRERPLTIQERETSVGRLLLGPTREVTVEQAKVMYASEEDGKVREAKTASRILGASLADLLEGKSYEVVIVTDRSEETYEFQAQDIENAVLSPLSSGVTLVFPDRGRSQWIEHVIEIKTE
ncbi:MAG: hypothetical protein KGY46_03115 [Anaerolineales bacterium]|nr:hypothetical protein [Anaerolineales bacterium]